MQSRRLLEDKRVADFLVSEANLYRSREVVTIPEGAEPLQPGTLVTMAGAPATDGDVEAILMYPVDPRFCAVPAVVIARDAEATTLTCSMATSTGRRSTPVWPRPASSSARAFSRSRS